MQKAGTNPAFFFNAATSLQLLDINCGRVCWTIHQLDQRHRCIVALAEAELEDTRVAAVACRVTWAKFIEQLGDHFAIAQTGKCQTAVRQTRGFAQRQDRLRYTAQFLGLRQRGLDQLMAQQRHGHVAEHRQAVAAGAVEFS